LAIVQLDGDIDAAAIWQGVGGDCHIGLDSGDRAEFGDHRSWMKGAGLRGKRR
jgi:hypothetical protein